jgi:very-short-patch-repair endonuclease
LEKLVGYARTLRKQPTDAEARLWRRLRGKQLGVRFRRQHPIAGYIVDFYCVEARLVIEVDGGGHASWGQRQWDERRARELERRGLQVMRVWNPEVIGQMDAVLEQIYARVQARRCQRGGSS